MASSTLSVFTEILIAWRKGESLPPSPVAYKIDATTAIRSKKAAAEVNEQIGKEVGVDTGHSGSCWNHADKRTIDQTVDHTVGSGRTLYEVQ